MSQGFPSGADGVADADVVEYDGRRGWSRRTWLVVLAVLSAVTCVGWVVGDRAREADETALAACSNRAEAALERKDERFEFMADYLRPAMLALPVEGRDSLYGLMSRTATETAPPVRRALETCARIRPAWFHPDLQSRRDAVVEHLTESITVVESIEEDGRRYYQDTPELDAQRSELFGDR